MYDRIWTWPLAQVDWPHHDKVSHLGRRNYPDVDIIIACEAICTAKILDNLLKQF